MLALRANEPACHKPAMLKELLGLLAATIALALPGCGGSNNDAEGRSLPTDAQVIADVTPSDIENLVDVNVVEGKTGESYLHPGNLVWTFDRGVVVRRKANLAEAPDAVVVVGGLARYQLVGDEYIFHRFLTTYNEYEGVDAPSSKVVRKFVESNLDKVFASREHNILGIADVELKGETGWTWHTPNSFTAPFDIRYRHRKNNTTIEERVDTFDIRFYRQTIESPLHGLMATERSRNVIGTETHDAADIDQMKTLRTNFR